MAVRNIVKVGDEILRKKSKYVEVFDARLHELIDDMWETLDKAEGAGLAAVQVGVLKRAVIINTDEGKMELINPVITHASGTEICAEGCLSIPGKNARIERPKKVKVKAFDRFGNAFVFTAAEFQARAVCHELDHLDGILYIDRIRPELQNTDKDEDGRD